MNTREEVVEDDDGEDEVEPGKEELDDIMAWVMLAAVWRRGRLLLRRRLLFFSLLILA